MEGVSLGDWLGDTEGSDEGVAVGRQECVTVGAKDATTLGAALGKGVGGRVDGNVSPFSPVRRPTMVETNPAILMAAGKNVKQNFKKERV